MIKLWQNTHQHTKKLKQKSIRPEIESKNLLNAQNGLNSSIGLVIALIVKTVFVLLGQ